MYKNKDNLIKIQRKRKKANENSLVEQCLSKQMCVCVCVCVWLNNCWFKLVQNGNWCNARGPFSSKLEDTEIQQQN